MILKSYNTAPFAFTQPDHQLTNEEFLLGLQPHTQPGEFFWTTHFKGSPDDRDKPWVWEGSPVAVRADGRMAVESDWNENAYWTVSTFFKTDDGDYRRGKDTFAGQFAISIDDVGSGPSAKIPWDKLAGMPPPTAVVETSPDNCQVVYRIVPSQDIQKLDLVMHALFFGRLGADKDPGSFGVTRYQRPPIGSNQKPKYQDEQGRPFYTYVVHWDPTIVYTLEQFVQLCDLNLTDWQGRTAGAASSHDFNVLDCSPDEDVVYQGLLAAGRVLGAPKRKLSGGDGQGCLGVEVMCPWVDDHSDGDQTGSMYFIGGKGFGGYVCHHGHCQKRRYKHLLHWLMSEQAPKEARDLVIASEGQRVFGNVKFETLTREDGTSVALVNGREAYAPPLVKRAEPDVSEAYIRGQLNKLPSPLVLGTPELDGPVKSVLRDIFASRLDRALKDALRAVLRDGVATGHRAKFDALEGGIKKEIKKLRWEQRVQDTEKKLGKIDPETGRLTHPILAPGEWHFPHIDDEGNPRPSLENGLRLIRKTGGLIRYNEMTFRPKHHGPLELVDEGDMIPWLADAAITNNMVRPTRERVREWLQTAARENAYHPFEEFLEELKARGGWDGHERLRGPGGLFDSIQIPDPTENSLRIRDIILTRWLYSIIAAARHLYKGRRGDQPRSVLVFNGRQYLGKTTWLAKLFELPYPGLEDCFLEGVHFDGTKDSILAVLGSLMVELGEIDTTMNRSESGQLKAFISRHKDKVRKPYAEEHMDIERRTIFSGTVNREDFLKDETGSTRFLVVRVEEIRRINVSPYEMCQLWAQLDFECCVAWSYYLQGISEHENAPWILSGNEMIEVQKQNAGHQQVSLTEELLLDHFDWENPLWVEAESAEARLEINPMTTTEVLRRLSHDPCVKKYNLVNILKRLTGQRTAIRKRRGSDRSRCWGMPPLTQQPEAGQPVIPQKFIEPKKAADSKKVVSLADRRNLPGCSQDDPESSG